MKYGLEIYREEYSILAHGPGSEAFLGSHPDILIAISFRKFPIDTEGAYEAHLINLVLGQNQIVSVPCSRACDSYRAQQLSAVREGKQVPHSQESHSHSSF